MKLTTKIKWTPASTPPKVEYDHMACGHGVSRSENVLLLVEWDDRKEIRVGYVRMDHPENRVQWYIVSSMVPLLPRRVKLWAPIQDLP